MAQMLEYIFIHYHIPPDEVMKKPMGTRAFMFACVLRDVEHGKTSMRCPFLQS